jgi:hypothetical protein
LSIRQLPRILVGSEEPIFSVLPDRVLSNLRNEGSENALVWNLMYPIAQPSVSLGELVSLRPLWGIPNLKEEDEALEPYYWGFSVSGQRLGGLDDTLDSIDGGGNQTEVDLFLVGQTSLILIEAKHQSGLGRCSRYLGQRCPEIHDGRVESSDDCRYWGEGDQQFLRLLEFGLRPSPLDPPPKCSYHYQLARTMLVGDSLARHLDLSFHLWMILPRRRWGSIQMTWLDFADSVRDDDQWRRLRVLSWEDVRRLTIK